MKTFDFVKSACGLSRKEKSILTNRLVPLLQHRIRLSLEHQCHIDEKIRQVKWGEEAYGTIESTRSFAAHFVNNTRTYFENFVYDLKWERLDSNRDGKILGFEYGKDPGKRTAPALDILPEIDVIASLLGYIKVPIEALPRRIDLGGGVVAAFRPPRSESYSLSVWVRTALPHTIDRANRSPRAIVQNLPPFAYEDYTFYAKSRNAIENRFTAFENRLIGKLQNILWNMQLFGNRLLNSKLGAMIGDILAYTYHLLSHVANGMNIHASKRDVSEPSIVQHQHLSLNNDGSQANVGSRQSDDVKGGNQHLKSFWTTPTSPFDSAPSSSTPEISIDDIIPRKPLAHPHAATGRKGSGITTLHSPNDKEILQSVIVGVSCVDPLYGHHMTVKLLKSLTFNDIPLVVPDPSPAAGNKSRHHRHCTLRLARAELVIFTAIFVTGALPAVYRSMNFALEHPLYAQIISASLIGTLMYTAWNSRRNIRSYTTLRITDAISARLVAQDETALDNIMHQFVEAYAESMVLIFTSELLYRRQQELLKVDGAPTAAENEDASSFLQSPEFASALNGGGWFADGTSPFIREKMTSIGLLKDGFAVSLEDAERAILGEDIDINP